MQWQTMTAQEKVDVIAPMLARGYAYSEIAREIPGATRNAVIGFCHRQGIKHHTVRANRAIRARERPRSASTDQVIHMIDRMRASGVSLYSIAAASGLNRSAIYAIIKRGSCLLGTVSLINSTLDKIRDGEIEVITRRNRVENKASSPDVRLVCDEIYNLPVSIKRFCEISGLYRSVITGWMNGRSPQRFTINVAIDAITQIRDGRR